MENDIFGLKYGHAGEPGSTLPRRLPRSTPLPPGFGSNIHRSLQFVTPQPRFHEFILTHVTCCHAYFFCAGRGRENEHQIYYDF